VKFGCLKLYKKREGSFASLPLLIKLKSSNKPIPLGSVYWSLELFNSILLRLCRRRIELKIEIGPPPAALPQGESVLTFMEEGRKAPFLYKIEIVSRMIRGADHSASV